MLEFLKNFLFFVYRLILNLTYSVVGELME